MFTRVVLLLLAVCFSTACTPPAANVDLAAEEQAIRKLTEEWFADEVRRDLEASLSYLGPDVVIQAEGGPTIQGIDESRSLFEGFFKIPYVDLVGEPRTVVVAESGDLAYDLGTLNLVLEGDDGRTEVPTKSTIIWRKLDGQWKAVVLSFSSNTPQTTSVD